MRAVELLIEAAEHLLLLLGLEVEPWLANHAGLGLFVDLQGESSILYVCHVSRFHQIAVLWYVNKLEATFIVVGDNLDDLLRSLEDHHLKPFNLGTQGFLGRKY